MKKREYTHRQWYCFNNNVVEKDIKELGNEGWKLVKVVSCGYNNNDVMAFFEREEVQDSDSSPGWYGREKLASD